MSCPTTTFCMAVDRQGYAMTYNGASWSKPKQFSNYSDHGIDVSCASATFCAAVNEHWNAFVYNGTSWSDAQGLEHYSGRHTELWNPYVSCPAAQRCVAVETAIVVDGPMHLMAVRLTDDGWSTLFDAAAQGRLYGLSCATLDDCLAVDSSGRAVPFDAFGWQAPQSIDLDHGGLSGISCAGGSCVAIDRDGYALHQ